MSIRPDVDPRIAALPPAGARRLAVRLTPDALRVVRSGHPWVFDQSIRSVNHEGAPGDLAIVFDDRRRFAAIGLWDPASPIRLKVLQVGDPVPIDDAWWDHRIASAIHRRGAFINRADTAQLAYRLVNGENDGVPGVVVDRYAAVLVVKIYSEIVVPHLRAILEALLRHASPDGVVLRVARAAKPVERRGLFDGDVVAGLVPDEPIGFVEHGLHFGADVRKGQKTGFFLDQRANRATVGQLSSRREVLDVFAATGGFSVHAAAGGATRVHSVDLSAPTLAAAIDNMQRNSQQRSVGRCTHTTETGDAFAVMQRIGDARERFDMVVVDPPSFATRQSQVAGALRAYERLTRLAVRTVQTGGMLVQASCSSRVTTDAFHAAVHAGAAAASVQLHEIERTAHDVDHPVTFPEGAYLKAGFWKVER